MNELWFYARDKKKHGPVARHVLQALLARGEMSGSDMVLQEGTTRWAPAGSVLAPATPVVVAEAPAQTPVVAGALNALTQVPRALMAAVAQTGRLLGYWGSKRQSARLARHACRAQVALGLGLFRRGLGEPTLLGQVRAVEDRLRAIGEAGGSPRATLRERDALLVRLAQPWLSSATAPPYLEQEHARAVHAERARVHQAAAHARSHSALYPSSDAGRARVLGGFALWLILLGVGVILLIPSRPTGQAAVAGLTPLRPTPSPAAATQTKETRKNLKQLNAELSPAVPVIETLGAGGGSGFLVRHKDRYLVVTNRHVVAPGRSGFEVHFLRGKGREEERLVVPASKARLVAVHREVDLAMLDVSAMAEDLARWGVRPVTLAPKNHVPEVGEHVFAIGHPDGVAGKVLTRTLSDGIISAVNRREPTRKGTFLQVTVAINPGNSGGPIFDDEGKVVAVSTFMIRRNKERDLALEALNFGLEVRYVHELLDDPSRSLSRQEIAAMFKKGSEPLSPDRLAAVEARLRGLAAQGYKALTGDLKTSMIPFKLEGSQALDWQVKTLPRDQIHILVVPQGSAELNLHVHDQAGKLVAEALRVIPHPEVVFSTVTGGNYRLLLDNRSATPTEGVVVLLVREMAP
jgi:S1-C subfamily serine protease